MNFFERLEPIQKRWDVLNHPFYARWERGELSSAELAHYAGEYRHAVVALAQAAAAAGEHADEEAAHVDLWDDFARAAGAEAQTAPQPETEECVRAWTSSSDEVEALAVLYAIESAQPAIASTKLTGLVEHYGFEEGPATEYLSVHAELDRDHAAQARAALEDRAGPEDTERLLEAAERALAGNWTLLDGVERAFGHAA
jgi:pyrroloquinoline-quinone synthase